jgi:branched-chain amino acid transport system permease protein
VLVTFGLIFVGLDTVRIFWGNLPDAIPQPNLLSSSIQIFGETYPSYRLFIIALGLLVMVVLYFGLEKTVSGRLSGQELTIGRWSPLLASILILPSLDLLPWLLSCRPLRSGAGAVFPVEPGMDMSILILTLIVVVVGGLGSLKGAAVGLIDDWPGRDLRPGLCP